MTDNLPFPLLLDGPTGTELGRRGVRLDAPLWSARALLDAPEAVIGIHCDYIEAGADVITTNSFRTNSRIVDRSEWAGRAEELTRRSVELARAAIGRCSSGRPILVAGSDAPIEDCYAPDLVPSDDELRTEHREHIGWLVDAGCDLILIETMNTLREAVAACDAASDLGARFMVSLVTDLTGERVLSGELLREAIERLSRFNPSAILTNCSSPRAVLRATEILAKVKAEHSATWEFGGYANSGEPDPLLGYRKVREVPVEEFCDAALGMMKLGARVVGSCCGTTPEHTIMLRVACGASETDG